MPLPEVRTGNLHQPKSAQDTAEPGPPSVGAPRLTWEIRNGPNSRGEDSTRRGPTFSRRPPPLADFFGYFLAQWQERFHRCGEPIFFLLKNIGPLPRKSLASSATGSASAFSPAGGRSPGGGAAERQRLEITGAGQNELRGCPPLHQPSFHTLRLK